MRSSATEVLMLPRPVSWVPSRRVYVIDDKLGVYFDDIIFISQGPLRVKPVQMDCQLRYIPDNLTLSRRSDLRREECVTVHWD